MDEGNWRLELGVTIASGWVALAAIEEACDQAVGHEHHSAEIYFDDMTVRTTGIRNLAYNFRTKAAASAAVRRVKQAGHMIAYARIEHDDVSEEEDVIVTP